MNRERGFTPSVSLVIAEYEKPVFSHGTRAFVFDNEEAVERFQHGMHDRTVSPRPRIADRGSRIGNRSPGVGNRESGVDHDFRR